MKIAYCRKSRIGDYHHLSLAAYLMACGLSEGLNDDSGLLTDIVWVESLIFFMSFLARLSGSSGFSMVMLFITTGVTGRAFIPV